MHSPASDARVKPGHDGLNIGGQCHPHQPSAASDPATLRRAPLGQHARRALGWVVRQVGVAGEEQGEGLRGELRPHGAAGAGITALYLYRKSGDKSLLFFAERAADHLLNTASTEAEGYSWPADKRDYGLGNGSSGIALFLLYTYLATRNHKYLDGGERALQFDLAAGKELRDGSFAWEHMDANTGILYPYWLHGSAGVGEVVLRYLLVTANPMYKNVLDRISRYVCRKYAVLPGLVDGLCGLGHFLLNCAVLLGDNKYERQARVVAAGVQLHLLRRKEGLTVCGDARGKISCDYATGSAGVAIFLSRLVRLDAFSLFPDGLLTSSAEIADFKQGTILSVGH